MSLSLSELQNQFHLALNYQASGEDCGVVSDYISADDRVQIYRNNFIISLTEILSLTYPLVEALVGEECFKGLARKHILSVPLTEGDVSIYGLGFAQTIESTEAVISSVPYLADMARLEWSMDECSRDSQQDSDNRLCGLSQLSQISEEQQAAIQLHLDPTLVSFDSRYAVYSIREVIINDHYTDLETEVAEYGYALYDGESSVSVRTVDQNTYLLLEQLQQGVLLGNIEPQLLQNLPKIIALNLITGFQIQH